jgi:hypothetical protein
MRFLRTRTFVPAGGVCVPGVARTIAPPSITPDTFAARMLGYVNSLPLTVLVLLLLIDSVIHGLAVEGTVGFSYYARAVTGADGGTSRVTPRLVVDSSINYPYETFLILALWAWCGWRLVRGDGSAPEASDVIGVK